MTAIPPTPPPKPSIHLNWEDWLPYLAECSASDEEKRLLIETLWTIMIAFADLKWHILPDEEISGQSLDLTAALRAAVLQSDITPAKEEV